MTAFQKIATEGSTIANLLASIGNTELNIETMPEALRKLEAAA